MAKNISGISIFRRQHIHGEMPSSRIREDLMRAGNIDMTKEFRHGVLPLVDECIAVGLEREVSVAKAQDTLSLRYVVRGGHLLRQVKKWPITMSPRTFLWLGQYWMPGTAYQRGIAFLFHPIRKYLPVILSQENGKVKLDAHPYLYDFLQAGDNAVHPGEHLFLVGPDDKLVFA